MDKDIARKYAQELQENKLLDSIISAMENVCYTNIKYTPISNRDVIDNSCLMLQCINNFKTLIAKAAKEQEPPKESHIRKIMSIHDG